MNEYKNNRLITLASEDIQGETSHFYYFLMGWMQTRHHEEMAEAARAWLSTHYPEILADFDRIYLDQASAV